MTEDEIRNMEAGEEIDTLVAEKVMGWHKGIHVSVLGGREYRGSREDWLDKNNHFMNGIGRYPEYDAENFHTIDWHPSESILWAWDVVENTKCEFGLGRDLDGEWTCSVWTCDSVCTAVADTAPLAICRAALLAVNGQPPAQEG